MLLKPDREVPEKAPLPKENPRRFSAKRVISPVIRRCFPFATGLVGMVGLTYGALQGVLWLVGRQNICGLPPCNLAQTPFWPLLVLFLGWLLLATLLTGWLVRVRPWKSRRGAG